MADSREAYSPPAYGKLIIAFSMTGDFASVMAAYGGAAELVGNVGPVRTMKLVNGYYPGRLMAWEGTVSYRYGGWADIAVEGRWRHLSLAEVKELAEPRDTAELRVRVSFNGDDHVDRAGRPG